MWGDEGRGRINGGRLRKKRRVERKNERKRYEEDERGGIR